MHPYSTDSKERKFIPLILSVISIGFAWILNKLLLNDWLNLSSLWWIEAPSVIGFYSILYTFFNNKLWKYRFFQKMGLIKIPNLNGVWSGGIISSFDEHSKKTEATLEIIQSWSQFRINLSTLCSKSKSITGVILTNEPDKIEICYQYINEPKSHAISTMHTHRGTANLIYYPKDQDIKGEYFSGRDRQNYGRLTFSKEANND